MVQPNQERIAVMRRGASGKSLAGERGALLDLGHVAARRRHAVEVLSTSRARRRRRRRVVAWRRRVAAAWRRRQTSCLSSSSGRAFLGAQIVCGLLRSPIVRSKASVPVVRPPARARTACGDVDVDGSLIRRSALSSLPVQTSSDALLTEASMSLRCWSVSWDGTLAAPGRAAGLAQQRADVVEELRDVDAGRDVVGLGAADGLGPVDRGILQPAPAGRCPATRSSGRCSLPSEDFADSS